MARELRRKVAPRQSSSSAILFEIRMRALGADVRLTGDDFDAAHRAATAFAAETGAQLIEDGRDAPPLPKAQARSAWSYSAGQNRSMPFLFRWRMVRCWRGWRDLESANTIADGIAVRSPFPEALFDLLGLVDDNILLVDDDALVTAMRLAHREMGVVLEPAGVASLAALLTNRQRFRGQAVGTILTGGNLTMEQMERWLAPDH